MDGGNGGRGARGVAGLLELLYYQGMAQLSLLDPNPSDARPARVGGATVAYADAGAILTRPTGRLRGNIDFALNPYQGCTFACSYCYAAFFAPEEEQRERWGQWVRVKTNAVERLRGMRVDLSDRSVLMSSATDPYQPIERRLELVRALLPILARRGAHLMVQTRSPLVTRDADLFKAFRRARVGLSITTDSEEVRKRFEPRCASIEQRLAAAAQLVDEGVRVMIGVSPMLPLEDPAGFARRIHETGAQSVRIGRFHENKGPFAAGTRDGALAIARELGWTPAEWRRAETELRRHLQRLQREAAA